MLSLFYSKFVLNIKRNAIRGLKYIAVILFTLFLIGYAIPFILLQIPFVQQKVSSIASTELSKKLNVPVKVGNVDFRWFNEIMLNELYLEDQQGEVLFEADRLSVHFKALPLLQNKIVFSSVRLFDFKLNLSKETPQAALNLQFVIDAFAKKDTTKPKSIIDLCLHTIMIRKGSFAYNIQSAPQTPNKFNAKHILLSDISANISLTEFNDKLLNTYIKKVSFKEQSGFVVDKIALKVKANRDSLTINDLAIQLPKSMLNISNAGIKFTDIDSLHPLIDVAPLHIDIDPSHIYLKDLSAFVPAFKKFTDTVSISSKIRGEINNLKLSQISVKYQNKLDFIGKAELQGITNPAEAYLFGQVNKLYLSSYGLEDIINKFSPKQTALPKAVKNIGSINFTGEISGFFDNLVAFGTLTSALGTIRTDLTIGNNKKQGISTFLKGRISTPGFNLQKILPQKELFGQAAFTVSIDAKKPINGKFAGNIDANIKSLAFKQYTYKQIELAGSFSENSFDGTLNIDDPNGKLFATGLFSNQGENSVFDFTASLSDIWLDKLNLSKKYDSPVLSSFISANFKGDNIDNLQGKIMLEDFTFNTTPSNFTLDTLLIEASGKSSDRKLTIQSNLINGEITGAYSFKSLIPSLINTFKSYLPAVTEKTQIKKLEDENNFALMLTIANTEAASNTFKIPFTVLNPLRIIGHYNNIYDRFRFEAYLPLYKIGKIQFESGYIMCDNPDNAIQLEFKTTNISAKGLRNYVEVRSDAYNNQINSTLSWSNSKEEKYSTLFKTAVTLVRETVENESFLNTNIAFEQSPITIKDSLWTLEPALINIANGNIDVNNFNINHADQFIQIDGRVSKNADDSLLVALNDIELSYIFDILNNPSLNFGGKATGTLHANDLYGSQIVNTDLSINNFAFNNTNLGKLNLYSEWDSEEKGILMLGTVYKNDTTYSDVNGFIYPVGAKAGLSLHFDANDLNLAFVQPFIGNVIQNLQGQGFGKAHLYGPFKGLTVTGEALVRNGGIGIEYLNTYYTFTDSIHLTPTAIKLNNVELSDKEGNKARVTGVVNHNTFKNITFNTKIEASNLLVYDVSRVQNPQISGKVYGTGTTTIRGNTQVIDFDVNLRSNANTNIVLDFMSGSKSSSFDFITYVSPKDSLPDVVDEALNQVNPLNTKLGVDLRMNFQVEMTPEASIEMVMDPISGDRIKGSGSGNLQVKYGNKTDLRMYGGYTIANGSYNFSLQQVVSKMFKLREGSSINFKGDPFDADLNIEALYYLTANLIDLNELFSTESRTQVPLNCVLKLDGMLRNPDISFDLELPSSSDELEQQMRSIINAEDMMAKQIIYLLVLGKFYTPEYMTARTGDFAAIASSTISAQLSSALNSITDKVQIGANVRTANANFEDSEVALMLSSQLLNNRLLFNGNFGYRDNALTNNSSNFVGEFDLEYKLNAKGEIRLKAYNHYNDMYRYMIKSAPTTQGVGIMFKKEFGNLLDLFKRKSRYTYTLPPTAKDTVNIPLQK